MPLIPITECQTVLDLLGDKSRWTQFISIRDGTGAPITCDAVSESCSFCLVGAIAFIYKEVESFERARKAIRANITTYQITEFNDSSCYEDVMHAVRKAGI